MIPTVLQSENELLKTFRPRDQKHVIIPWTMKFPLQLGHYLAWTESSGVRIYLVFKRPEWASPRGIAFRRDQQGSATSPAGVCDWCIAQGPSDQIGLLTATVNSKTRVGVNLCLDLSCASKLENIAQLTGQDVGKMLDKLTGKMARFCEEALRIGVSD